MIEVRGECDRVRHRELTRSRPDLTKRIAAEIAENEQLALWVTELGERLLKVLKVVFGRCESGIWIATSVPHHLAGFTSRSTLAASHVIDGGRVADSENPALEIGM